MTVEYSKLNSIRLAQPPHHTRPCLNVVLIEAEGYPQPVKHGAKIKLGTDDDGHVRWGVVQRWRGLDKRVAREYNSRYNGAKLREVRATKGVGRPWITLLNSKEEILIGPASCGKSEAISI